MSHREKLLEAAVACLHEKGYARTTARDLVAASETNLGSIVYHFGTKEKLLNEAIAKGFRSWTAAVERAVFASESDDVLERFDSSLRAMIGRFEELRPLLVAFVESFPQAVHSPELRDGMAAAYEDARAAGARMVQRALTDEGIEPGPQARVVASILMALCDGLMLQWLVDPDRTPHAEDIMRTLRGTIGMLGGSRPGS